MSKRITSLIALMGVAASMAFTPVYAESPVKLGTLECAVNDVDKTLMNTHIVLKCDYVDANGNNEGTYQGTIDRTGLDIGNIETTTFAWIVSTVGEEKNVKLDGTYVGAQAGASVGAGAGANWLTGGFNGKISLQPWSAEGKSGFGIGLGGQKLVLTEM